MEQAEEYVKRIVKVLIFIENNIDEDLGMEGLAKLCCYSPFHFHRVFQVVVGETVHQYVKRLRMQRAASKLRYTDQAITEIALDSSYDTPSAFTKAFKQFMGSSPKQYRALYTVVNTMIKELAMIEPDKIESDLPDLNLLFIRKYGNYTRSPDEAWVEMKGFIKEHHLDHSKIRFFGISHDDPQVTSESKLRYDAAILLTQEIKETGKIGRQVLHGGKYAIFTHRGSYNELGKTFDSIFLKWLPNSFKSFDESRSPFCEYLNMEYVKTDPDKLKTKVYIPLL